MKCPFFCLNCRKITLIYRMKGFVAAVKKINKLCPEN